MNDVGKDRTKQAGWCFVPQVVAMRAQTHNNKCSRMCVSMRKLTLAVALSLTVSSHQATNAVPMMSLGSTAPMTTISQEVTLTRKEHKPRGASIAHNLRSRGIPDSVTVMLVSALPVVELRGGIPLGHYLGLGPLQTLLLAIIGNLAPVLPTMLLLRIRVIRRMASGFLERARKAADSVSNARSRVAALALFVGVPLPGTGAWTGCFVAFLLGMRMSVAFGALAVGVGMAGIIVSAVCMLGWIGALIVGCVVLGGGGITVWRAQVQGSDLPSAIEEEEEEEAEETDEMMQSRT